MGQPYDEDDETEYFEFDGEAAAKAGLFGVPIEDLDDEHLSIIDSVSKGE
ncbi:hypothetical protein KSS93_15320 [Pseudomonas xanthosomatis]|nr:hypothetical protein [Pseudomonas xanthosomatis]QXH44264.1 hypothetical protein KSS93_15320 [Pseudomonas xanthosomatis]